MRTVNDMLGKGIIYFRMRKNPGSPRVKTLYTRKSIDYHASTYIR